MLVAQTLGFVILMALMARWVYPRLRETLRERRRNIHEAFEKIERDRRESEERLGAARGRLSHFGKDAGERLQKTLDEAARLKLEILQEAAAQADQIRGKAGFEANLEREKTVLELRQEMARMTFEAADRLVAQAVDEEVHELAVHLPVDDVDFPESARQKKRAQLHSRVLHGGQYRRPGRSVKKAVSLPPGRAAGILRPPSTASRATCGSARAACTPRWSRTANWS
jgi:F-type H+-transporting ATPase subunit b